MFSESETSLVTSGFLSVDDFVGQWYITQTTSPVWKDKRNVVLTYSVLSHASDDTRPRLDDLITYQTLDSQKSQTMRGTDTPSPSNPGGWTWRGTGLLKLVTSQWEILGHSQNPAAENEGGWMVVFAQKSLFTPAVVNICTRNKTGMGNEQLQAVKAFLWGFGKEELGGLADDLQHVLHE